MAPELKPEKEILLDEMLGESTRHTVIQLPSGAVVDNYTNLREKPQQERDMGSLDYGLSPIRFRHQQAKKAIQKTSQIDIKTT